MGELDEQAIKQIAELLEGLKKVFMILCIFDLKYLSLICPFKAVVKLCKRSEKQRVDIQHQSSLATNKAYASLREGFYFLKLKFYNYCTGKDPTSVGNEENRINSLIAKHKGLHVDESLYQTALWDLQELNDSFVDELADLSTTYQVGKYRCA